MGKRKSEKRDKPRTPARRRVTPVEKLDDLPTGLKVVGQTACGTQNIVHDPAGGEGYEYKTVPRTE